MTVSTHQAFDPLTSGGRTILIQWREPVSTLVKVDMLMPGVDRPERYRARALTIESLTDMGRELQRLGLSYTESRELAAYGVGRCILIEQMPVRAAHWLGRTLTAAGGMMAAGDASGEPDTVNGLIMANAAVLSRVIACLLAETNPALVALGAALRQACVRTIPGFAPHAPQLVTPYGRTEYEWQFGRRTYIMAILNVTPDSFSDDGLDRDVMAAFRRADQQAAAGADIIDVGGESSEARDHAPIPWEDEARRVIPVVEYIRRQYPDILISVDTWKARVAAAALDAGAHLINDVGAMRRDPEMREVAAHYRAPIVVMHDQPTTVYGDIMSDIYRFFCEVIEEGHRAGVKSEQIIVDAGFGFGKSVHQDLLVTRRLRELTSLGRPILHAPSRKRTIGRVLKFPDTVEERIFGTAATVTVGIANGADMVRVHDVPDMVRCVRMTDALLRGYDGPDE